MRCSCDPDLQRHPCSLCDNPITLRIRESLVGGSNVSDPNILLDSLLAEAGISHAGLAARINKATATARRPTRYDHPAVARWIRDNATPRGDVPEIIYEIIGPKVERVLRLEDIGMARTTGDDFGTELPKAVDQAVALWRADLRSKVSPVGASMMMALPPCPDLRVGEPAPRDRCLTPRPTLGVNKRRPGAPGRAYPLRADVSQGGRRSRTAASRGLPQRQCHAAAQRHP